MIKSIICTTIFFSILFTITGILRRHCDKDYHVEGKRYQPEQQNKQEHKLKEYDSIPSFLDKVTVTIQ